ncbi:MAG: NTP transferase domain-containing protein [Saprospiraceae bacterium]
MLTVIVLAAGMSRRMGPANKLLLPFRGRTMLETTLDQIVASGAEEIIVVLGHESDRILPLLEKFPVKTTFNPDFAVGMTTSIQAGVRVASADSDGFMICLSDMPLIESAIYRSLTDAFFEKKNADEWVIVQPVFENTPGNPVIFSAWYKNEILALTFNEGCKPILQKNLEHVHRFAIPNKSILMDADTEAAYRAL